MGIYPVSGLVLLARPVESSRKWFQGTVGFADPVKSHKKPLNKTQRLKQPLVG